MPSGMVTSPIKAALSHVNALETVFMATWANVGISSFSIVGVNVTVEEGVLVSVGIDDAWAVREAATDV